MNLLEILIYSQKTTKEERERAWADLDVDICLWPHLHACFDDEGNLTLSDLPPCGVAESIRDVWEKLGVKPIPNSDRSPGAYTTSPPGWASGIRTIP